MLNLGKLPVSNTRAARKLAQILGWRALVPALRTRAQRRLDRLAPGQATVVTVNWNSWSHLEVLIDVVRRRSPADTRIIAVDNGSEDESRQRISARDDAEGLLLPA